MLVKLPKKIILAVISFALVAGCAGHSAPHGWLPSANEMATQAYGAWIRVEYMRDGLRRADQGEFLAVDRDTVYLLTFSEFLKISIPRITRTRMASIFLLVEVVILQKSRIACSPIYVMV